MGKYSRRSVDLDGQIYFLWKTIKMVIHIGDLVRLSGKTRHGKNRIREHGDLAEVAHIDGVLNALKKFCVIHKHGDSWRWIDLPEDEHMNWEMVEKNDKNHIENFISKENAELS